MARKNQKTKSFSFEKNCIVVFQWNIQQNAKSDRSAFRNTVFRAIIETFSPQVAVLNEYHNEYDNQDMNKLDKYTSNSDTNTITTIFARKEMGFNSSNNHSIQLPKISCLIENKNYLFLGTHIDHELNSKNIILSSTIESIKKLSCCKQKSFFMIGDFNCCITTLKLDSKDLTFPSSVHNNMFTMNISINENECRNRRTNPYLPSILECFVEQPVEISGPKKTHLNVDSKKHSSSYDYFITNDKSHDWSIYYLTFSGKPVKEHKEALQAKSKQPRPSDHIPVLVVGKPKTTQ